MTREQAQRELQQWREKRSSVMVQKCVCCGTTDPLKHLPDCAGAPTLLEQAKVIPDQREKTHGSFAKAALITETMKQAFNTALFPRRLPAVQQYAAEMILSKLARIVNGDAAHIDHWADVAGYAQLVVTELKKDTA